LPANFEKGGCEFLTAIFQYLNFLNKFRLLDNRLGTKGGSYWEGFKGRKGESWERDSGR
jgi:hypothetical protein